MAMIAFVVPIGGHCWGFPIINKQVAAEGLLAIPCPSIQDPAFNHWYRYILFADGILFSHRACCTFCPPNCWPRLHSCCSFILSWVHRTWATGIWRSRHRCWQWLQDKEGISTFHYKYLLAMWIHSKAIMNLTQITWYSQLACKGKKEESPQIFERSADREGSEE